MAVDESDVARRLEKLADELADSGELRSSEWRRAFLTVWRHVLVPRYWHDEEPGAFPARWRMVDNATRDHQEWLDTVYSNRILATELTGIPAVTGEGMHPQVTSSSTMPGLVMAMLEDLDVVGSVDPGAGLFDHELVVDVDLEFDVHGERVVALTLVDAPEMGVQPLQRPA